MNEETIEDFKQFIAAAMTQQTSDIRGDISDIRGDIRGIKQDIKKLDNKIDDLSEAVAEAITDSNEATADQLSNHDKRITKLEAKVA